MRQLGLLALCALIVFWIAIPAKGVGSRAVPPPPRCDVFPAEHVLIHDAPVEPDRTLVIADSDRERVPQQMPIYDPIGRGRAFRANYDVVRGQPVPGGNRNVIKNREFVLVGRFIHFSPVLEARGYLFDYRWRFTVVYKLEPYREIDSEVVEGSRPHAGDVRLGDLIDATFVEGMRPVQPFLDVRLPDLDKYVRTLQGGQRVCCLSGGASRGDADRDGTSGYDPQRGGEYRDGYTRERGQGCFILASGDEPTRDVELASGDRFDDEASFVMKCMVGLAIFALMHTLAKFF